MQNGQTLGFALTGSYCTFQKVLPQIEHLVHLGYRVIPILSEKTAVTDTRFGTAEQIIHTIEAITGETVITAIPDAEPIGPKKKLDLLLIAPCTGNTIAKLATGIADSTMTAWAQTPKTSARCLRASIFIWFRSDRTAASKRKIPWWRIFR